MQLLSIVEIFKCINSSDPPISFTAISLLSEIKDQQTKGCKDTFGHDSQMYRPLLGLVDLFRALKFLPC